MEEPEDALSRIIRIVKRDTPVWYAKKDGELQPMMNRGRQIHRILKRDGEISGTFSGEGQSKNLLMDRQLDKGLNQFLRSTKRSSSNTVDDKHLILVLTQA